MGRDRRGPQQNYGVRLPKQSYYPPRTWQRYPDLTTLRSLQRYKEFATYFDFGTKLPKFWVKRLFDLFNPDFNGVILFPDFLLSMFEICIFDVHLTHKLAFRLLHRCGATINMQFDQITEKDVFDFIIQRYGHKDVPNNMLRPISIRVFGSMNTDNSGGISYAEFISACKCNRTFLLLAHQIQIIAREKIFGKAYWEQESRARADEHVLSFSLVEELDRILAADTPPHNWNADFPQMVSSAKQRTANRRAREKTRRATHVQVAKQNYGKMSGFLSRLGMSSNSTRGAFFLWKKNTYLMQSSSKVNRQPAHHTKSIHELVLESTSRPEQDVDELIAEFESSYMGQIEHLGAEASANLDPAQFSPSFTFHSEVSAMGRASNARLRTKHHRPVRMSSVDEVTTSVPQTDEPTPETDSQLSWPAAIMSSFRRPGTGGRRSRPGTGGRGSRPGTADTDVSVALSVTSDASSWDDSCRYGFPESGHRLDLQVNREETNNPKIFTPMISSITSSSKPGSKRSSLNDRPGSSGSISGALLASFGSMFSGGLSPRYDISTRICSIASPCRG